mgnify:CR=1 FL=1
MRQERDAIQAERDAYKKDVDILALKLKLHKAVTLSNQQANSVPLKDLQRFVYEFYDVLQPCVSLADPTVLHNLWNDLLGTIFSMDVSSLRFPPSAPAPPSSRPSPAHGPSRQ